MCVATERKISLLSNTTSPSRTGIFLLLCLMSQQQRRQQPFEGQAVQWNEILSFRSQQWHRQPSISRPVYHPTQHIGITPGNSSTTTDASSNSASSPGLLVDDGHPEMSSIKKNLNDIDQAMELMQPWATRLSRSRDPKKWGNGLLISSRG